MNKKGAISIETIIVVVLALLVLIILAATFSGGIKNLMEKLGIISGSTTVNSLEEAKTRCTSLCSSPQAFQAQSYFVKDSSPVKCSDIVTC